MKSFAFRPFERERAATSFDYINDELRVLPIFVLRFTDVERAAADVTQIFVTRTDGEFAGKIIMSDYLHA